MLDNRLGDLFIECPLGEHHGGGEMQRRKKSQSIATIQDIAVQLKGIWQVYEENIKRVCKKSINFPNSIGQCFTTILKPMPTFGKYYNFMLSFEYLKFYNTLW